MAEQGAGVEPTLKCRRSLADAQCRLGLHAEAARHYKRCDPSGDDPAVRMALGWCLMMQSQMDEGVSMYEAAVDLLICSDSLNLRSSNPSSSSRVE